MEYVSQTAPRRNALMGASTCLNHRDHAAEPVLTPGGRVVYRRMKWASPSLCNAVAALAGYAEISH